METVESLVSMQTTTIGLITRTIENYRKLGTPKRTLAIAQSRMNTLRDYWEKCQLLHGKIESLTDEPLRKTDRYFTSDMFSLASEAFEQASDYLVEKLESLKPAISNLPGSEPNTLFGREAPSLPIKLPPIKLPTFTGEYQDWENFRDLFESLIDSNRTLSNVDKLHYLKAHLTGEAGLVLKNLAVTEANYLDAWKLLKDRYNNKRFIVNSYLQAFMDIPNVNSQSGKELKVLRDKANDVRSALISLERPVESWEDLFIFIVVSKLDRISRREWEFKIGTSTALPTFKNLDEYLTVRIQALEAVNASSSSNPPKEERSKTTKPDHSSRNTVKSHQTSVAGTKCILCDENHPMFQCKKFRSKSVDERRAFLSENKCCFNCLEKGHSVQACYSKKTCLLCKRKHHTMTHRENTGSSATTKSQDSEPTNSNQNISTSTLSEPRQQSNEASCSSNHVTQNQVGQTILPTVIVTLIAENGRSLKIRALLDQGSQVSCVTESVAQILRVRKHPIALRISTVGETPAGKITKAVKLIMSPRGQSHPQIPVTALVLPKLTAYLPKIAPSNLHWKHLEGLQYADHELQSNRPVELLLGSDVFSSIILEGLRKGPIDAPVAQNTIFGWVISGPIIARERSLPSLVQINHAAAQDSLEESLARFWELEEIPKKALLTDAEVECEHHFSTTHKRKADGRYEVRLPFKIETPLPIGDTSQIALRLFKTNETRLRKKPELYQSYQTFLKEYEDHRHMERVDDSTETSSQVVYLPHHPVLRESSQTTKLRVVFNASCRSSNGSSINEFLHTGVKLQADLCALILRWRTHKYVLSADLEKMFRQIRLCTADTDYQRIFWRNDPSAKIESYRLLTVTYGTACAPYIASRVLKQLADDEKERYPLAAPILREEFYVDDAMFGADDLVLARQQRDQLMELVKSGGFTLRKWASNSTKLLEDLPEGDHSCAVSKTLDENESLKVLGIVWKPRSDTFEFSIQSEEPRCLTKRSFFSMLATTYDPLGWVSPVTITAKIILQKLWLRKLGWDDPLPSELNEECHNYHIQLTRLSGIKIPRWTGLDLSPQTVELHGFADASISAYAAVVYVRVTALDQTTQVTMLYSKTKVAPLKVQSIPRLELCAAVLVVRAIQYVQEAMRLSDVELYCWSDSAVVLSWLKAHPGRWKTFVANRVSLIQSSLPKAQWKKVPGQQNPADCASRGISVEELTSHNLWWQGPPWLLENPTAWPEEKIAETKIDRTELRAKVQVLTMTSNSDLYLPGTISSWPKLVRITAYVFRFLKNSRRREDRVRTIYLTVKEIENASNFWIKLEQRNHFYQELSQLQRKQNLNPRSVILELNPFLDPQGILRVGGRLRHSNLAESVKHPIIIPKDRVAILIIREAHERSLHGGTQLTLGVLKQQYWVLNARNSVKTCIRRCVICARQRAVLASQQMSDLPPIRVNRSRPFAHSGLDYAGPYSVRTSSGRGQKSHKCYIALFVCLSVRAIHLELVNDYSTDSFLAAFERFSARRGLPSIIYSDNGTNFRGADRELTRRLREICKDANLRNRLSSDRIDWQFIPPSAPHFGGLWEAGVKSVKFHLKRILGNFLPTYEEFITLLNKIESCLNSRPISPLFDDLESCNALTPGHFLVGTPLKATPTPSVLDLNENRLSRWQTVQLLHERFWKAWQNDYLNSLQRRTRWKTTHHNLEKGDLVLIKNDNLPPSKWELGRILECHAGPDKLVRVVTVKTAHSSYKRPITKLCKLPVDRERDPN